MKRRAHSSRIQDNRSVALAGKRCLAARKQLGLSRELLSRLALGNQPLSIATIKRCESGANVYLATAHRLSELLQVSLQSLLAEPTQDSQEEHSHLKAPATIDVVPLRTEDKSETIFAHGLSDDLLTRLSRLWFPVVFNRRIAQVDRSPSCGGLRPDYSIEGSVRRGGGRVRVVVHLIRTKDQCVVWSDRYECALSQLFAEQDRVVAAIIEGVTGSVLAQAYQRSSLRSPEKLSAWDLAVAGAWHFRRFNREANVQARGLLEASLKIDPYAPQAMWLKAMTHQRDLLNQWSHSPQESLRQLSFAAEECEKLYPQEAPTQIACAYAFVYQGQREAAQDCLKRSIQLDPNLPVAYSLLGQTHAMVAATDLATEQFDLALSLCPQGHERWSTLVGVALNHYVAKRYQESIDMAQMLTPLNPRSPFGYGIIASANAHLGKLEPAHLALARFKQLEPDISAERLRAIVRSTRQDIATRYLAGLQAAGLD